MKGTITSLVNAATLILCSLNGPFVDGISMNAENVCPVEEELALFHIYGYFEISKEIKYVDLFERNEVKRVIKSY